MMSNMNRSNLIAEKWEIVSLGDLVKNPKSDLVDGPFGSNLKASEYIKAGVPVLKIQNIKANRFVRKQLSYITPAKANELSRHSFQAGDLIITKLGDPLGLCCRVPADLVSGVIVADLMRLRPDEQIVDSGFLIHAINSSVIQDQFKIITKGTTRSRVNLTIVRSIEINLPPLNEQRRIFSKIEELFSELDDGIASLKTARAQLKVYRQALLKQAFEGKLTAQWRKDHADQLETADQLLARIQAERQSRYEERIKDWGKSIKAWESGKLKGKKPIKPREAEIVPLTKDAISDLPELPSPWIWTSLSELSDHIVDGTHKTPKYVEQGVHFISAKDINDFTVSFAKTKYITAAEHEELWRRCRPSEGDILLTKSGTIGRVAVVKTDHEFSVFESVAVIPISRSVEPQFFAFQIFCTVQGSFGAANQKGVGVRHLHLEDIRKLPTSLPSLPEQQEIVRLLDEQFTVIQQNEREIDAALKRSEALRQSILKKAFAGQLVAQDPADEPAGVLLERIRAERKQVAETEKSPAKSSGRIVRKSKTIKKFT
jgi:type I restriction enzyme S subunit